MDEQVPVPEQPAEVKPQHGLTWVDFVLVLIGIAALYPLVAVGTSLLARIQMTEQIWIYLNGLLTQIAFLFLILVLYKVRKWEWTMLGWRRIAMKGIWGNILKLYLLTWGLNLTYAFILLSKGYTPPANDVYTRLFTFTDWKMTVLNILLACVIAPVCEEIVFRGILFGSLRQYMGRWTAIALSATIFSGLHFQLYGFFPRFVLGVVLAYLYEKNQSLFPSIVLHAGNNLVASLLILAVGIG